MSSMTLALAAMMCLAAAVTAVQGDDADTKPADAEGACDGCVCEAAKVPPALGFTMKSLAGEDVPLAKYHGKVVLIVNVASRCGHTRQYADLQALHEKYAEQGLAILGFPCNQFGGQEPGTAEDIQQFCSTRYNVTFDMFDKTEVKGDGAAPLFAYLTGESSPLEDKGEIKWNFEKFLLDRSGTPIARFRSKVNPSSEQVVAAIESALAASKAEPDAVAAAE
jgi:glutathione peroxidase